MLEDHLPEEYCDACNQILGTNPECRTCFENEHPDNCFSCGQILGKGWNPERGLDCEECREEFEGQREMRLLDEAEAESDLRRT